MASCARTISGPFDQALSRVVEALKNEGFGVTTQIDIKDAARKTLGTDFRNCRILGVSERAADSHCRPRNEFEPTLPCEVVVQETQDGRIEVAAGDPVVWMRGIDNPALLGKATEIGVKLRGAVGRL